MSQRSQIFVRYQDEDGNYKLIARDYDWNFLERMISRCRYTMEWLKENVKYFPHYPEKIIRILDTNFDMKDCIISNDLLKEYQEFAEDHEDNYSGDLNDYLFYEVDNDDGKLLIDIDRKGNIKYAFLDYENEKIMSGFSYVIWDSIYQGENIKEEIINICNQNIIKISEMATLMTQREVEMFMECDYSKSLPEQERNTLDDEIER